MNCAVCDDLIVIKEVINRFMDENANFDSLVHLDLSKNDSINLYVPTCSPGSNTKTEYDAIRAPSSAGCCKSASGFWSSNERPVFSL